MRIRQTGVLFDSPESTPGYLLVSPIQGERALLLGPDAEIAYEWRIGRGTTNWCYLLPNGNLFASERSDDRRGPALTVSGRLSEYDRDGGLVWRHHDPYQHHDARRLPSGAVYSAFLELNDQQKAAIKGGVPGSETEGGPFGEAIREVDEAGEVVWEWSFEGLDVESHPLRPSSNRWSYGHVNTVCPLDDGNYLVSAKNLSVIFIVDRESGDVVWEFQHPDMSGQHDAQMLDTGNILILNNRPYAADIHHSQVWEIDPRTDEVVWRYVEKDSMTSFFSTHIGSVQRLPSGNTLVCEGSKGCIFEVTPAGDLVREYVSPHFAESDQFGWTNWLFRARWYAPDAPEIVQLRL